MSAAPVTFSELPEGRIEALMNHILVGEVASYPLGGARILGTVRATYWMFLPVDGLIEPPQPATSVPIAKQLLLKSLADWHEEADPERYAGMITDLRKQAEGERG